MDLPGERVWPGQAVLQGDRMFCLRTMGKKIKLPREKAWPCCLHTVPCYSLGEHGARKATQWLAIPMLPEVTTCLSYTGKPKCTWQ